MKIPSSICTLLIGIVLTLISFWYSQNHSLLPTTAFDKDVLIDGLFNTFLLVEGILIYITFRYRLRWSDGLDGSPVHGNMLLKILSIVIVAIIVIGISICSFEVYEVYNDIGSFNPHTANGESMVTVPSR
jgi:cytochrome c oxidase subunit 2